MQRWLTTLPGFWLTFACIAWLPAQAEEVALDPIKHEIAIEMQTEPPSLNTLTATDAESSRILDHLTEGLIIFDQDNHMVGGVAQRWELSDTGATFWLRRDAIWDDGVPVTAADFVFAWRQVLHPSTASQYAFLMYPIRNAERINKGELPPEDLGVRALDEHTLHVDFWQPCSYFLGLTTYIPYRPLREDVFKQFGQRHAAEAANMRFNGPFTLTEWVHGARLRLEKNPRYWNAQAVQLQAINIPYITPEPGARFNLFKDGKIALANLNTDTMREAMQQHMLIRKFLDGTTFFLEFNHRAVRPTRSLHLRRAMQRAFDSATFSTRVIAIPGNEPAYSLFPSWLPGAKDLFSREHPPRRIPVDLMAARRELELARQELGVAELPPLVLLMDDSPNAVKQSEYLQDLFERTLGLQLRLDSQIFKQRLAKMNSGEFDIVASGWGPDYPDPLTFGDLMSSWNLNNRGRYHNPEYDRLVRLAQSASDLSIRFQAFADMQKILIDDVVVLPQYERGYLYVQHPRLSGVIRRTMGGDPNFAYARITD